MSTTDTRLAFTKPRYATDRTRLTTFSRSLFFTKLKMANASTNPSAATSTTGTPVEPGHSLVGVFLEQRVQLGEIVE